MVILHWLILAGLVATEDTAQALTTMLQDNKTLTHLDLESELDSRSWACIFGLQQFTSSFEF